MKQLVFNDKFDNIIEEIPKTWKNVDDIPDNIKKFIFEISEKMIIYDKSRKLYCCSTCFGELNDYYCERCNKRYDRVKYDYEKYNCYIEEVDSIDRFDYYNYRYYFAFDVVDGEAILYTIQETSSRDNLQRFITSSSSLSISGTYLVRKDYIMCLQLRLLSDNSICCYYYQDIYEQLKGNDGINDYYLGLPFHTPLYENFTKHRFLYTENFEILKDTIYKYTNIWETKDFIKDYYFDILCLTFEPIYYPQFEYLVKFGLYNLAYDASHLLKGKTFKEIFGVGREFLPFMKEINISYQELLGLRLCKCKDKFLIGIFGGEYKIAKELLDMISPNCIELGAYLKNFQFEYNHLPEYCDYIRMAKELGYNLKDKNILYPPNFMEEHDRLYLQIEIINDPDINTRIKHLSNVLCFNYYEDDKYIIFPAKTLESMLDEGIQQHNCLRTYIVRYSNNNCQIYFMREKDKKTKSLVTIEVRGCSIVQARTRFNELPNDEIMQILKKWERTLILIENGD